VKRSRRRKLRRRRRRQEILREFRFLTSTFEELVANAYDVTYPLPRTFYLHPETGERIEIADENGRFTG